MEYVVEVEGTIDPENVAINLDNIGPVPVVNPRISVNDRYDWYDVNSMVKEITEDCDADEEKALAIWAYVLYKRFQRSPHDRSSLHPVRAMNGYGYGICGHTSAWLKCLFQAAGLKARIQELWGHTVSEVFYDNDWHMFDGNVKVFYLDRDNESIASLRELESDSWLIERTIHSRDPWFRGPDPPGRNEQFVRFLTTDKDNYEEHAYDDEIAKNYTMAMTLRPGEKLLRWWQPVHRKFEGRDQRSDVPLRYASGQLVWEPDLSKVDLHPYLLAAENVTTSHQDGVAPAVHIADLQDALHTRPSRFSIPIQSPYPIVGGRAWLTMVKEGTSGMDQLGVFFGKPGWRSGNLYTLRKSVERQAVELDLDASILREGAIYSYQLGFNLRGNADSEPPTQTGLDHFKAVADLQVSPHSLPALSLGRNRIRFTCESSQPIQLRIVHRWNEINDSYPPRVVSAISPENGEEITSLDPVLRWKEPEAQEPSARAVDYQVMVSSDSQCRWPLSPTLHQNTNSAKTEWSIPKDFLNPNSHYYWKIRGRNGHGDIGDWSPVFCFRTAGNAE
jgi:hypothetical protein